MTSTKYPRYQDYVIRDGQLVGEFDQMYKDFDDPWHQTNPERFTSEKAVALNLLCRLRTQYKACRVVEVGCGLGDFTARIAALGIEAIGIDVSETAISKARARHGASEKTEFFVADFQNFETLFEFKPDVIVMSEITWYVLEHLQAYKQFIATRLPDCFLLHLLMTYGQGGQKYGCNYFTDLGGILNYFGMSYLESGQVNLPGGGARTWFLGSWDSEMQRSWMNT